MNRSISCVITALVIILMLPPTIGCTPEGGTYDELNRLRCDIIDLQTRVDRLESHIGELQIQDPTGVSDGADAGMLLEEWESRQKRMSRR